MRFYNVYGPRDRLMHFRKSLRIKFPRMEFGKIKGLAGYVVCGVRIGIEVEDWPTVKAVWRVSWSKYLSARRAKKPEK